MCRDCRFPPPVASVSGAVADGTNGEEGAGPGEGAVDSSSRSNAWPAGQQAEVMPRRAPTACSLCSQDLVADPAEAKSLATIIGSLVCASPSSVQLVSDSHLVTSQGLLP